MQQVTFNVLCSSLREHPTTDARPYGVSNPTAEGGRKERKEEKKNKGGEGVKGKKRIKEEGNGKEALHSGPNEGALLGP